MNRLRLLVLLSILIFASSSVNKATAQGCNLGIMDLDECRDSHGNPTYTGKVCCNGGLICFGPGQPNTYCYMGYGVCPPGTTGQTTTANWTYDSSCSCMPPFGGCASPTVWNPDFCACVIPSSPVLVDTLKTGFRLTSAINGVVFDIRGDGHPVRIAWTASESGNAFLALDRNHNGIIDNGKELFGNVTTQPPSSAPNGFLAC